MLELVGVTVAYHCANQYIWTGEAVGQWTLGKGAYQNARDYTEVYELYMNQPLFV